MRQLGLAIRRVCGTELTLVSAAVIVREAESRPGTGRERAVHETHRLSWDGAVDEQAGPLRQVHGIYRFGSWLEFQLRYRLGPYVPKVGPTTLFIAAKPKRVAGG